MFRSLLRLTNLDSIVGDRMRYNSALNVPQDSYQGISFLFSSFYRESIRAIFVSDFVKSVRSRATLCSAKSPRCRRVDPKCLQIRTKQKSATRLLDGEKGMAIPARNSI
jgi:hypothetical protein